MYRSSADRQAEAARYRQMTEEDQKLTEQSRSRVPGNVSNACPEPDVRPQFINVGIRSANYR